MTLLLLCQIMIALVQDVIMDLSRSMKVSPYCTVFQLPALYRMDLA